MRLGTVDNWSDLPQGIILMPALKDARELLVSSQNQAAVSNNFEEELVWTMCCRGRKSGCPEVAVKGDQVWIKDDNGAVVTMSIAQLYDVYTIVAESTQASVKP